MLDRYLNRHTISFNSPINTTSTHYSLGGYRTICILWAVRTNTEFRQFHKFLVSNYFLKACHLFYSTFLETQLGRVSHSILYNPRINQLLAACLYVIILKIINKMTAPGNIQILPNFILLLLKFYRKYTMYTYNNTGQKAFIINISPKPSSFSDYIPKISWLCHAKRFQNVITKQYTAW